MLAAMGRPDRIQRPRTAIVVGLAALVVFGCAGSPAATATMTRTSPPTASPDVPTSPSAAPATPAPQPSPSSTPRDLSFSSSVYPYSIVLPAGPFEPGPINVVPPPGAWKPATDVWDGTTVISPSSPHQNDSTSDADGNEFFVVGHATDDGLDAFAERMVGSFAMWHGCSRTPTSRPMTIDDEPAVLIASPCGQGGVALAARLFVVHEGFGLVFNIRSFRPVDAQQVMDRLAEYVAGVDLRP
jgi:hypothetical protein